jgi:hypothetical protein
MILLWAIVIGLVATLLRARLTHRTLKLTHLRWEWLILVTVIPQIFLFQIHATAKLVPESVVPIIHVVSMAGLLIFAIRNITRPGFWALGLGLLGNFLVIILNGGWMPISVETLSRMGTGHLDSFWVIGSRLGHGKDRIMPLENTNLAWLSDRLILPKWIPLDIAFSMGDIFITIGTILLLWSLSSNNKEKE